MLFSFRSLAIGVIALSCALPLTDAQEARQKDRTRNPERTAERERERVPKRSMSDTFTAVASAFATAPYTASKTRTPKTSPTGDNPSAQKTRAVAVGLGTSNRFSPDSLHAELGDVVIFHFNPVNHSIAQSSFESPCQPSPKGFFSGFVNVPLATTEDSTFSITITDENPIWYYCAQGKHCQDGMVGVINPPMDGGKGTLKDYRQRAKSVSKAGVPTSTTGPISKGSKAPDAFAYNSKCEAKKNSNITGDNQRPVSAGVRCQSVILPQPTHNATKHCNCTSPPTRAPTGTRYSNSTRAPTNSTRTPTSTQSLPSTSAAGTPPSSPSPTPSPSRGQSSAPPQATGAAGKLTVGPKDLTAGIALGAIALLAGFLL